MREAGFESNMTDKRVLRDRGAGRAAEGRVQERGREVGCGKLGSAPAGGDPQRSGANAQQHQRRWLGSGNQSQACDVAGASVTEVESWRGTILSESTPPRLNVPPWSARMSAIAAASREIVTVPPADSDSDMITAP